MSNRLDHKIIFDLVENNSSVLDLGCGDGALLKLLEQKGIYGQGIEINEDRVQDCLKKNIAVLQNDIDIGFKGYSDKSFDFVILNKTLQATHMPLLVMKEALRVGKKVLVSFPNFGYWLIRFQLFFIGQMPRSKDLPYEWYDTPNIHLVTIKDFIEFCRINKFQVEKVIFYDENKVLSSWAANLLSPYALFVF